MDEEFREDRDESGREDLILFSPLRLTVCICLMIMMTQAAASTDSSIL